MPEHDLATLMTLDIGLTLAGILTAMACVWALTRHLTHATRDITQSVRDNTQAVRDVATMSREVAFMIRRQYADIDRDLQEIKDLLGGQ